MALTCRVWSAAVRPHIFRRIVLSDTDSFERFHEMVTAQPFILCWIYELCFSGNGVPFGLPDWFRRFPDAFPVQSLPKLRAVDFVDLKQAFDAEWDCGAVLETLPKFASFTAVRRLGFLDCMLPYDVFKAISGAFFSVTDIHLHGTTCTAPDPQERLADLPLPQNLLSLRVHGYDRLQPLTDHNALRTTPVADLAGALSSLKVFHYNYGVDQWLVRGVGKILRYGMPHQLEHLVLVIPYTPGYHNPLWTSPDGECIISFEMKSFSSSHVDVAKTMDLRKLTNLKTFYVRRIQAEHSKMTPRTLWAMRTILPQLCSSFLHTLVIVISFSSMDDFDERDFSTIDSCCADRFTLPGLAEARLVYRGGLSEAKYSKKIKKLFKKTHKRGILKIVKEPHPDVRRDIYPSSHYCS